ncbi:MAG: 6-bladed beta-propeller, partial [Phocaeicola plebeius]|nr:6-bladed beta-propeller [Phocaeicola plebeius]
IMKYSVIGGVCLLLSSCSFRQRMEPVDSAIATLAVPANEVKGDIPFDSLFRLKEIIPLQTTDESLVQQIDKLSFYDGRIYLLDARKKQVVVFDGQGRFERVVNHLGQGPGEYQSLVDMQLKNDTLYLLDRYGAKLLLYSLDDVFLSELRIPKAEGMVVTEEGYALHLGLGSADGSAVSCCSYSFLSRDGQEMGRTVRFNEHLRGTSLSLGEGHAAFCHIRDKTIGVFPFQDTLYTLVGHGQLEPYRIIRIGDLRIGLDDSESEVKRLRDEGVSPFVFAYYEWEGYSFFSYYYGHQNRKYVLADTKGKIWLNASLGLDGHCLPVRVISFDAQPSDERMLSLVYPSEVLALSRRHPESDVLAEWARRCEEEDNPLLVFYQFSPPSSNEKN